MSDEQREVLEIIGIVIAITASIAAIVTSIHQVNAAKLQVAVAQSKLTS